MNCGSNAAGSGALSFGSTAAVVELTANVALAEPVEPVASAPAAAPWDGSVDRPTNRQTSATIANQAPCFMAISIQGAERREGKSGREALEPSAAFFAS